MDEILNKANELGLMIKGSEIFQRFEEISHKLDGDQEARKMLEEYAALSDTLMMKEKSGVSIEVSEKQELERMGKGLSENQLVMEFIATQTYYLNMIQQIQQAISNPKGDPITPSKIIKPGGGKIITGI